MSIKKLANLSVLLVAAAFLAVGCGDSTLGTDAESVGGNNTLEELDLNQEFGGLAFSDEQAGFGDELLLAEAQAVDVASLDEDDEDRVLDDEPELRDDPQLQRTYLRILWGQLDGRPEDLNRDMAVDWTGQLEVSGGIVAVKHTILFERATDYLKPRDSRHVVSWSSWTGPHMDGLLLCVLSRGGEDGELSFRSGPFSQTFKLSELAELNQVFRVDDQGNSISFEGREKKPGCPNGFIRGYWKNLPDHNGGAFRGVWKGQDCRPNGFVMGRFGVNDAGEHVFAGKIIDPHGNVRGLMRGVYTPNDDGTGSFEGHWVSRFGKIEGRLAGRYASTSDTGEGHFRGRWGANCSNDDPAGDEDGQNGDEGDGSGEGDNA